MDRPKYECKTYDNGHVYSLDQQNSGPNKTTFTCNCGESIVEYEDAGTGA